MSSDFAEFETTLEGIPFKNYVTRCKCGWIHITHAMAIIDTSIIYEHPKILKHRLDHIEGKVKTFAKHSNNAPSSALMKDITEVSHDE